ICVCCWITWRSASTGWMPQAYRPSAPSVQSQRACSLQTELDAGEGRLLRAARAAVWAQVGRSQARAGKLSCLVGDSERLKGRVTMRPIGIVIMTLLVGIALVVPLRTTSSASQVPSVRLALVNVPDDVLRPFLPDFQKQTGKSAEIVYRGNDPFAVAREGKADLVISHYGHPGVQPFITAGLGLWPHTVFANTYALI